MSNIGDIAQQEVASFKNKSVSLTSGGKFNQYDTIQRIIKYSNNEFWDCSNPDALFYQIGNSRRELYSKSIDVDSKEFYPIGIGKTNWFQAWILRVRFKQWVRENRFSLTLDEVSSDISLFGSSVWKKYTNESGIVVIENADLRNLYFDPTVKDIIDTPIVEIHYMTKSKIMSLWKDRYEEIIENASTGRDEENNEAETTDIKYRIYERWGEYEDRYYHYIGTGGGDNSIEMVMDEIKIKNGKPKDFPYYDFHGERIKGRWLGLGTLERLFHIQEQVNTLVNQNNEVNSIASLLLFRTNDGNTTGNLLDAVENGQIIDSEDMQEIGVSNRFLQGFISQLKVLEEKANELCYINESISGETPPSGVPFRSLAQSSRAAVSTFAYIKTGVNEKMGYILQEEIMPSLVKGFNREDIIEISEDENDIRLYDQQKIKARIEKHKLDRAKKGFIIFEEELEELKLKEIENLQTNRREEKIGKNFFDFEYGIAINPASESVDKAAKNAAIDSAISMMISAPAIVNTPIYQQKLESNNIPPFRLTVEEQAQIEQQGAGKPLPQAPQDNLSSQSAI